MSSIVGIIVITGIAGIIGTGLGGLLGAILNRDSSKVVSLLLSFAGGIMMAVVCFDLLPDAVRPEGSVEDISVWIIIIGVIIGYLTVYLLNNFIDKYTNPEVKHIDINHPKTADDVDELYHADHYNLHASNPTSKPSELLIAGIVMACAIALHNMPEGMVIGATYASQGGVTLSGSGLIIAIVIGFHNIPEGMAVSVPLISGGMSKWKAIVITALSGAPTILGALLGYSLGLLSPVWLSIALSFAGGAMLYVVFAELLPEAFLLWKSKAPGAFVLVGILVGFLLVKI